MPAASKYPNIKRVFDDIRKQALNKAQLEITKSLPGAIEKLRDFTQEAMAEAEIGSMTGNTICSSGVAIYRDGQFIACATTSDIEGKGGPIHVTLKKGDVYPAGSQRYDGDTQGMAFRASQGVHNFMANERVVSYLRHYPPTRKEGLAYRFAMYLEYNQNIGRTAMLLMADELEKHGGNITEFMLEGGNWKKQIRTR